MADKKYTKEECLTLLQEKQRALQAAGFSRYPQRTDFQVAEVVAIKAFCGPWPRALEAAGLKPPRADDRLQRNREKRARAKRARRLARQKQAAEKKKQGEIVP